MVSRMRRQKGPYILSATIGVPRGNYSSKTGRTSNIGLDKEESFALLPRR